MLSFQNRIDLCLRAVRFCTVLFLVVNAPLLIADEAPPLLEGGEAVSVSAGSVVWEWRRMAADAALGAGFSSQAERLYLQILEAEDVSKERKAAIHVNLAISLIQQGRYRAAQERLASEDAAVHDRGRHLLFQTLALYGANRESDAAVLKASFERIDLDTLQRSDRSWYFLLQGLLEDAMGSTEGARNAFNRARESAQTDTQLATIESLLLRESILDGTADEATAADLEQRLAAMRGDRASFPFAKQYAITLHQLDRTAEAVAVLDRQLSGALAYGSREREQLLLLKSLILGVETSSGRATLRELIRSGTNRESLTVALQLLTMQDSGQEAETGELRGFLSELISRTEPHPLLGEIYYLRAQLALARGDISSAEADAGVLLQEFPGLVGIANVYRLLAFAALQRNPPQFRTAADFLIQLRENTSDNHERRQLNILIGDCYFLNGDFRNAADFYASARQDIFEQNAEEARIFLRLITAKIRSGDIDEASRLIDEVDFRTSTEPENRWVAEWNLVRELSAQNRFEDAHARVRGLLVSSERREVSERLIFRLRWLEAWLALQTADFARLNDRITDLFEEVVSSVDLSLSDEERSLLIVETMLLHGEVLLRSGQGDLGLRRLSRLREDFSGTPAALRSYLVEANFHSSRGEFTLAQERLNELSELSAPNPFAAQALFESALLAKQIGPDAFRGAVQQLNALVENHPNTHLVFPARLLQGDLLRSLNDFGGARSVYENIISRFPEHPQRYLAELGRADCMLALARADGGQLENVIGDLERIFELPGLPIDLQIEAGYKWGFAAERREFLSQAEEIQMLIVARFLLDRSNSELAALGPNGRYWIARSVLDLGMLLEQRGRYTEARRAYQHIAQFGLPGQRLAQSRKDALLFSDDSSL